jgi:hypothetical protein
MIGLLLKIAQHTDKFNRVIAMETERKTTSASEGCKVH